MYSPVAVLLLGSTHDPCGYPRTSNKHSRGSIAVRQHAFLSQQQLCHNIRLALLSPVCCCQRQGHMPHAEGVASIMTSSYTGQQVCLQAGSHDVGKVSTAWQFVQYRHIKDLYLRAGTQCMAGHLHLGPTVCHQSKRIVSIVPIRALEDHLQIGTVNKAIGT